MHLNLVYCISNPYEEFIYIKRGTKCMYTERIFAREASCVVAYLCSCILCEQSKYL